MANIIISDLRPAGAELFGDSESFINELTDEDLNMTHGGITPGLVIAVALTLLAFAAY
jgi:lactobin A/cerein 7B family class IIb bacteriocin